MREVATAVGLAEGERGVRSVLAAVARLEPVSTRKLSRTVDLPVPIVASICGELRKRAIVAVERPTQLTALGRELFAAGGLNGHRSATCPKCAGKGVVARGEASALLAEMRKIAREAPGLAWISTSATARPRRSCTASSRCTRRTRSSGAASSSSATTI